MTDKLCAKAYSSEAVEEIIAKLIQNDYLSDLRYTQHYIQAKSSKYGRRRIYEHLRYKGIDHEVITEAMNALPEISELEVAQEVLEKKFQTLPLSTWDISDPKERLRLKSKLIRYLATRGFPPTIIYNVVETGLKRRLKDFFEE